MKCPFFIKRVGSSDWKGIKCGNQTLGQPISRAVRPWEKADREKRIVDFCNGDYTQCLQYKNNLEQNKK